MAVGELGRDQSRDRGRNEPEPDQPDEQRAAHRVRVDRHGRPQHPFADGRGGEGRDDPADD
jgi:hypothetical protein